MHEPYNVDVIDDNATKPLCMQQSPTPAMLIPSQTKITTSNHTTVLDTTIHQERNHKAPSNHSNTKPPTPCLPTTPNPNTTSKSDTWCLGTEELVPIIQHNHTTQPTQTNWLDETVDWVHNCHGQLISQSIQHYDMMAKVHAQIYADLQELVQIMPIF